MAKMYGKFDARKQNSKGWTKAAMRHDEERQEMKDFVDEVSHPIEKYTCDDPYDCKECQNG